MHLASVKPHDLAVIQGDSYVAIGEHLARQGRLPQQGNMVDLIDQYESLKGPIDDAVAKGPAVKIDPKQLRPPVERPSKIWAAAGNYRRGSSGLNDARGRGEARTSTPQEILEMTFLKPSSAVTGPEEAIVIPAGAKPSFQRSSCVSSSAKKPAISPKKKRCRLFWLHHPPRCHGAGIWVGKGRPREPLCSKGI